MPKLGELMDAYIAAGEAIYGKGYYERSAKTQEELAQLLGVREDESFNDAIRRVCARLSELEACNTRLLCERDDADGWAGRLADAIAAHMRADIGEHSNLNNPWANALELIDGTFCR